jgi:hypothetical protein
MKMTAFAMIAAVIGSVIYRLVKFRDRSSLKYGLLSLPFFPLLGFLLVEGKVHTVGYNIPNYLQRVALIFSDGSSLLRFFQVFVHESTYFILMSYLIFAGFTLFLVLQWKKIKNQKKEQLSIFMLYGLFSILFLTIITATHIYRADLPLYSRYVSVGLPVIIMLGVIGYDLFINVKNPKKKMYLGSIFILLTALVLLIFPLNEYTNVNTLDLIWIRSLSNVPVLAIASLVFIVLGFLIINRGSPKKIPRRKQSIKHSINSTIHYLLLIAVIISLVVSLPSIGFIEKKDQTLNTNGLLEPGRWLMKYDPHASVVLEDVYSAFSGGGMSVEQWYYLYGSLSFWFPKGHISVLNQSELKEALLSENVNADYLLSTHDLSGYYQPVKKVTMEISVASPRRQEHVQWSFYKCNETAI